MAQKYQWNEVKQGSLNILRTTTFKRDGFDIRVDIEMDWDHNWGVGTDAADFRGRWGSADDPQAIKNPFTTCREDRWFVPQEPIEDRVQGALEALREQAGSITQEDEAKARKEAEDAVNEDMRIASDPEQAGFMAIGTVATVSLLDVELACSSLWGTEIEATPDFTEYEYIQEVVEQEIEEAIRLAKKKLAELQAANL